MKVLFLDIDGVCNSEETLKHQYERTGKPAVLGIDPVMAFRIGKIQLDTGCEVVLSSSWRHWPDGIKEVEQRVVKLYDHTPTGRGRDNTRGDEVKAWLDNHPEVEVYAIVDDDNDFYDWQPLFKTEWKVGITDEIAEQITQHLNKG